MSERITVSLLAVLTLSVLGCGVPAADSPGDDATQESTATTASKDTAADKTSDAQAEDKSAFECPVTIPPQPGFEANEPGNVTYSENFPAPDPWPAEYPHDDKVWYGTDDLWTALSIDGDHGGRKSVWWSANFPGGTVEGEPEVWVTWTRLDTDEPVVLDNDGKATNAYTPFEGWFMIAGIDPKEDGCWEVEATYKGATLNYVYEKTG